MKQNVSKTVMHKCTFSNEVHNLLETEQDKPRSKRTPKWRKPKLTVDEKAKLFDQIVALHQECSEKIAAHQYERRAQKRKEKTRQESGYYEKKAARKQKWEAKKLQEA